MAKKSASSPDAPVRVSAGTVTDDAKTWAFIGILLPIVGYVLILLTKKGGAYAEYYGKQGLVLGITWIILRAITFVLAWLVWGSWMIMTLVWVVMVILWILGIVYAFSGEKKSLPVIGEFASRF